MPSSNHICRYPYYIYPVSWPAYDPMVDYCGPRGNITEKLVSRYILGFDTNKACWAHDCRYEEGGTEEDRQEADTIFLIDMISIVTDNSRWWSYRRYHAYWAVYFRYLAVRGLGSRYFNYE